MFVFVCFPRYFFFLSQPSISLYYHYTEHRLRFRSFITIPISPLFVCLSFDKFPLRIYTLRDIKGIYPDPPTYYIEDHASKHASLHGESVPSGDGARRGKVFQGKTQQGQRDAKMAVMELRGKSDLGSVSNNTETMLNGCSCF